MTKSPEKQSFLNKLHSLLSVHKLGYFLIWSVISNLAGIKSHFHYWRRETENDDTQTKSCPFKVIHFSYQLTGVHKAPLLSIHSSVFDCVMAWECELYRILNCAQAALATGTAQNTEYLNIYVCNSAEIRSGGDRRVVDSLRFCSMVKYSVSYRLCRLSGQGEIFYLCRGEGPTPIR